MKNADNMMRKLNKKLSPKPKKEKNAKRSAAQTTQPARPWETSDAQTEIEKAFVAYLKENNEVPDETLLRYIAEITR